ncbi:MAG: peptidoglycan-binding protein [Bacteroidaceae bacterium]|nr:peptidoglycan-binding protein [Bacteroidaceae bacterium]
MAFTPRLDKPKKGNPYYNTKSNGGYSTAIKGKLRSNGKPDIECDVLANCVGYAFGRVNEIAGDTKMSLLEPRNAENWFDIAKSKGLEVGSTPRLGAVMCWAKGKVGNAADGAGHVAVVEKILDPTTVITSESGYNAQKAFWTQTRLKGSGNWGQSSQYKFLGFIYHPNVKEESTLNKTLRKGDTGSDVKLLQKKLADLGYYYADKIDGDFGRITKGCLMCYQEEHNLSVDGVCGPATRKALGW